jgi:type I pantothenate kinase
MTAELPRKKRDLAPYHRFTRAEWSRFRDGEPMTLTAEDIQRLRSLNDPISLHEAEEVYLPLARLMSFYVEATQAVHRVTTRFLGADDRKVPYIIGVAGSVASGKSTTARILRALLRRWRTSPKVDLVTTDGFLFPNAELERRGLMDRKGFPESYDRAAFIGFLSDIKSGNAEVRVPVYSHLIYDVVPGEEVIIDRPDILIVEGLNILQPGELPKTGKPILFASDFLDFSIYIDADENDLRDWFMARFRALRETAFTDEKSFFHRFAEMSQEEAEKFGLWAWEAINLPNLRDNILPTRSRADLILRKAKSHAIEAVELRKV